MSYDYISTILVADREILSAHQALLLNISVLVCLLIKGLFTIVIFTVVYVFIHLYFSSTTIEYSRGCLCVCFVYICVCIPNQKGLI